MFYLARKKMRTLLTLCGTLFFLQLSAQRTVRGVVTDADNEPLIAANVVGEGTEQGAITDLDGNFELRTTATAILVSYVGYTTQRIPLGTDSTYRVEVALEAIDVTGCAVVTIRSTYLPTESVAETLVPKLNPIDVLNNIPGVLAYQGTLNTNRITLRGIGNRSPFATAKLRAYLDQIPLTNGSGETILEDLDLSILRSIDAEAGPGPSGYGAALGGTVRLRTLLPEYTPPEGNRLELGEDWTVGDFGLRRQVHRLHYADAGQDLRVHHHRTRSDGFRDNNEYRRVGTTVLYRNRHVDSNYQLTFFGDHTEVFGEIPSALNETDFRENPERAAFNWASVEGFEDYQRTTIGLGWDTQEPRPWTTSGAVFLRRFANYESRPFNILRERVFAYGARAAVTRRFTPDFELRLGGEFNHEDYAYTTNRTDGGRLDTLRSDNLEVRRFGFGFVEGNYARGDFRVRAGLNVNLTDFRVTDRFPDAVDVSGQFGYGATLAPRLVVDYTPPNWNFHRLTATVARGFSIPSLEETLLPDGNRNPDIEPETGWNYELGLLKTIVNTWAYELRLYHMDVRNLLVARRTAEDQFLGVNAGRTAHTGAEVRLGYQTPPRGQAPRLEVDLAYQFSRYRFTEFRVLDDDFSGNELTGQPAHALKLRTDLYVLRNWTWQTTVRILSEQPITDDNSVYGDGFTVVGTALGYRRVFDDRWTVRAQVGVDNVFDADYAAMFLINARGFGGNAPRFFYPGLPRNGYFRVGVGYRVTK